MEAVCDDLLKIEKSVSGCLADLVKIVFSKPTDKNIVRARAHLIENGGKRFLQIETFTSDNKVKHRNLPENEAESAVAHMAAYDFAQTNIIGTGGEIMIRFSSKGKLTVSKSRSKTPTLPEKILPHNKQKKYIIDATEYADFLSALGGCDEKGNVFDKKRSKYRQLNRFVELLDDVYEKLPQTGRLTVCDLCCGKSYLTFAVFIYLKRIKGRDVTMYGVDLKSDVIAYCAGVAEKLGLCDMHFLCEDISGFDPGCAVDMVISLHACDVATDIVLAYAMKHKARLILSTPCCHHEMFHQLGDRPLEPLMKHSILKQKFADALTDSMRALMLEANGYKTEAIELIDPDETPKNVMLRAVYTGKKDPGAAEEYERTAQYFGISPTLAKLMKNNGDTPLK